MQATIVGTDGSDVLLGTAAKDVMHGLGGDDIIYGLEARDIICGGGNDAIEGNGGCDSLSGGAGDDRLYLEATSLPLGEGKCADGYVSVEAASGNAGDDYLEGSSVRDALFGHQGDDELRGIGFHDLLDGGAGNDILDGGSGGNWVSFTFSPNPVIVNLSTRIATGWGRDTLIKIHDIDGSRFSDRLIGNSQKNSIFGGSDGLDSGPYADRGDDLIEGRGGDDGLFGDGGDDVLKGGAGKDFLLGDNGSQPRAFDRLYGGRDRDECAEGDRYSSCERIGPF